MTARESRVTTQKPLVAWLQRQQAGDRSPPELDDFLAGYREDESWWRRVGITDTQVLFDDLVDRRDREAVEFHALCREMAHTLAAIANAIHGPPKVGERQHGWADLPSHVRRLVRNQAP